mmetsp:Transcript_45309/g.72731  ORF Transcript_45309/g.72731 Transcript_45309/m.72731 type:complete len:205 (-) Transcript_45309:322-936(-)
MERNTRATAPMAAQFSATDGQRRVLSRAFRAVGVGLAEHLSASLPAPRVLHPSAAVVRLARALPSNIGRRDRELRPRCIGRGADGRRRRTDLGGRCGHLVRRRHVVRRGGGNHRLHAHRAPTQAMDAALSVRVSSDAHRGCRARGRQRARRGCRCVDRQNPRRPGRSRRHLRVDDGSPKFRCHGVLSSWPRLGRPHWVQPNPKS